MKITMETAQQNVEPTAAESAPETSDVEVRKDPGKEAPASPGRFSDLELSTDVQRAIEEVGYDTPTDIQAEIIPHLLSGRDVLAQSQTGSGKTAAFALPLLSGIDVKQRQPQILVLAPTRELATQVAESFARYASKITGFEIASIYGGADYEPQRRQLRRGAQVVVGTPGRIIDHIKRGTLDLNHIKCLVLDEADEMLNMGFLEDVQFVLEQTPSDRQLALFSATLPAPVRKIAQNYQSDPARITIKRKTMTAESIRQRAVFVAPRDRVDTLVRILEVEETDGVIVFTRTREATVTVAEQLEKRGLSTGALNGDMAQRLRQRTVSQFKEGQLNILVATDVAARGLDVNRVSHVINYDVPQDCESYIHRVGRTGRAGRKGEAIMFLSNGQKRRLRSIERATKQPIEIVQPPSAAEINAIRVTRFKERIVNVATAEDLTDFQKLIDDCAAESGQPLNLIAAALAHIGQAGIPFLVSDRPTRGRSPRDERKNHQEFRDRAERGDSGRNTERPPNNHRRRRNASRPPERGMDRYRIEVGRDDGVKPGNIVGAVANEGGIDGEYIGPVTIHDTYSTIDLPEGMPRDVYQILQQTRVAGKQLRLSRAPSDGYESKSRGGGNSKHSSFRKRAPAARGKKRKRRNLQG